MFELMESLLLTAQANDGLRFDGLIAGTALGVEEAEQFAQPIGVSAVAQERTFASDLDQALMLQLLQMMRERGVRYLEFSADFTDYQAVRVGGEQQAHDAESRLRSHRGQHVGVARDVFRARRSFHISII